MNIELDGGGKVKMACVQKQWHGNAIMQIARFAGEEVMAIDDDAGGFSLHYLGFTTGGFTSIDDAKSAAPCFVKAVLTRMIDLC